MNIKERYESAKEIYAGIGVDVEEAVKKLEQIPISMHCWQGDDVMGFEGVRAEHRERLFETELEPENTAEKEAATV